MDRILQATSLEDAFDRTLESIVATLKCERALVFFGYNPDGTLIPRAGHGLDHVTLYETGAVSQQLLLICLEEGKPSNILDVLNDPQVGDRLSAVRSGVRSVLTVPLQGSLAREGMLYADSRLVTGAFGDTDLKLLDQVAGKLMQRLAELGEQV